MIHEHNKTANKTKSYTVASFYNDYLDSIEKDTVYDIDYNLYRAIITDYFKHLQHELIEEGKTIKLPYRMGSVQIIKSRPKHLDKRSLRIDYQATKQTGKLVLLLNEHSDYFKYRCLYSKENMVVPNKSKYQLVMTRANKRRLAVLIKSKQMDYQEI